MDCPSFLRCCCDSDSNISLLAIISCLLVRFNKVCVQVLNEVDTVSGEGWEGRGGGEVRWSDAI